MAQISAEEIKDTRVVYLEIEAQNLDKKVLIFKEVTLHASLVVMFCACWPGICVSADIQLNQ